MVLSRLWYFAISLALAYAVFLLFLATNISDQQSEVVAGRLLTSSSKAVRWYLTDDARRRASALLPVSLDSEIVAGLAKSTKADKLSEVDQKTRSDMRAKLATFRQNMSGRQTEFDIVLAIDAHGRLVAQDNFERGTKNENFEMGGYSIVADALHGWIRDDAWVLEGQIYRVVARPVQTNVGSAPVGCVVAAKRVDDRFAQQITDKTQSAVAFFAGGSRVASGNLENIDRGLLEVTPNDLAKIENDVDYQEKGATLPILLREGMREDGTHYEVSAIFTRMPGEAWDLGAGYVVGHSQSVAHSPLDFQNLASDKNKDAVPLFILVPAALGLGLLGLIFTLLEHTMPLVGFRRAMGDLADKKSQTDVLKPSTFRGAYKKIAQLTNDALDKIAAKGGHDRGPADLERVLGPLPDQPQMSAFSVPGAGGPAESPESSGERSSPGRSVPQPATSGRSLPKAKRSLPGMKKVEEDEGTEPSVAESRAVPEAGEPPDEDAAADDDAPFDEEADWRKVYADFIAMKKKFGEPTDKLTFDKFRGTLQRNKDALVSRHNCTRVKFRVYEKQGRAALKASPVK